MYQVEALTNDRLREEVGKLPLRVAPEDRPYGHNASVIMAPFTHPNPLGSRFGDGTYGVFYAGETLATAIAETRHHRALFMARTNEPKMELDMRVYTAALDGSLVDIRGKRTKMRQVYDPDSYRASQAFARPLRERRAFGIVYDSVRLLEGRCVAVFRPSVLSRCREDRHLAYIWDGTSIVDVYEKRPLRRATSQRE